MDHETDHLANFTGARMVTFTRLRGGHGRWVVRLASLARRLEGMILSLNTALVVSTVVTRRGACGQFRLGQAKQMPEMKPQPPAGSPSRSPLVQLFRG